MLLALALLAAGEPCVPTDCGEQVACWQVRLECLVSAGQARAAVAELKPVADRPAMARLLARAYAADGNTFWAQRTLHGLIADNPKDCDSRAQLVWLAIQQGQVEVARELLAEGPCPLAVAERGRWHLLGAYAFDVEGRPDARDQSLEAVGAADALFAEDLALYRHLRARDDPGWIEPVSARVELVAGYTSNGLAGSPTDPPTGGASDEGSVASGLARVEAFTTLVAPSSGGFRPSLELGLKAHGLSADDPNVREQSFLELSARPALLLGRALPRVTLSYSADLLLLNHSERGRFFEGHRAEVDVEVSQAITLFAGGGRRLYRERGRNRWEVDGGAGVSLPAGARLRFLGVLAARTYSAEDPSYNQVGGTVAAVARWRPGYETLVRASATYGYDRFPDSGDRPVTEQAYGTSEMRRDHLVKASLGGWSPPLSGVRVGLRYELAWRNSSADGTVGLDNYGYTEHRVVAGLRWFWGGDPFLPRALNDRSRVALDYGLDAETSSHDDDERIRDILRQDEAARRGSSCVN